MLCLSNPHYSDYKSSGVIPTGVLDTHPLTFSMHSLVFKLNVAQQQLTLICFSPQKKEMAFINNKKERY